MYLMWFIEHFQTAACSLLIHAGQSNCVWGQNEWCASLANAKRCNVCKIMFIVMITEKY